MVSKQDLIQQLSQFINELYDLRVKLNGLMSGHTYMSIDEAKQDYVKYRQLLSDKVKAVDYEIKLLTERIEAYSGL
jgi:hypothetical protein